MSGPDVNTDGIRTHASHVGSYAGGVDQAVEASQSTQIGDQSFGILCGWLAPAFHLMESAATSAYQKASSNLRLADTTLDDMASDYDHHDEQAANLFRSLEGGA